MAELQKNPVFILRLDGGDLKDFFSGPQFEPEMASIFSRRRAAECSSLRECIIMALQQLTVDHGLPPSADPWVLDNLVSPALQLLSIARLDQPAPSEEIFMEEFRKLIREIIERLQEKPIIVAHTLKICDGSGVGRLLSNNDELRKTVDLVWGELSKEFGDKPSVPAREVLRAGFSHLADAGDLPCYGTVDQVDAVFDEVLREVEEEGVLQQEQFREVMTGVLGSLGRRLKSDPISILSDSVVHDPLVSPSSLSIPAE